MSYCQNCSYQNRSHTRDTCIAWRDDEGYGVIQLMISRLRQCVTGRMSKQDGYCKYLVTEHLCITVIIYEHKLLRNLYTDKLC